MRVIRWRGLQKVNTLSPQIEMTSPKFMSQPGACFRAHLLGVWCRSNASELKGRPQPKSINSQMKESLRETCKSISPKYHSVGEEAYVTISRKECHQAPEKLTTTEGKGTGPWSTDMIWKGQLAGAGLPAYERPGQGKAGLGGEGKYA